MIGFFERLLEFLGIIRREPKAPLERKPLKEQAASKEADAALHYGRKARAEDVAVPSGSSRPVLRKKATTRARRPLKKQASLRKRSARRKSLQFEIEEVLKEANLLKKKLAAREKRQRARRRARKSAEKPKPAQAPPNGFQPLSKDEVQSFRERLQKEKMLSDFDIQRLKANLSQNAEQKPLLQQEERELRAKELDEIRKSLAEGKSRSGPQPSGTVLSVPQGASVIIGPQGVYPQVKPAAQVSDDFIDDQIKTTEALMKSLEQDYLKRRIPEEDFKQRMSELSENLRELRLRKKSIEKKLAQRNVEEVSLDGSSKPVEVSPRQEAVQARPAVQQPPVSLSPQMQHFLEERFGNSDEERLLGLEKNVEKLMQKFNLSEAEVERRMAGIDSSKTIESFDKLVGLIELEQKTQRLIQEQLELEREKKARREEKVDFGKDFGSGTPERRKEEVKAVVEEIAKHRIVTDFDKLLDLVQSKGKVKYAQAAKDLKISDSKMKECLSVLEENQLVHVEYPPIGSPVIFDVNYSPPQKKQGAGK